MNRVEVALMDIDALHAKVRKARTARMIELAVEGYVKGCQRLAAAYGKVGPANTDGGRTKTGTVVQLTKLAGSKLEVKIAGLGSSDLSTGKRGSVAGGKVEITDCKKSYCYGVVSGTTARKVERNPIVTFV